jgi:hypothetical protein
MTLALILNYLDKDNFTVARTDRKPRAIKCHFRGEMGVTRNCC